VNAEDARAGRGRADTAPAPEPEDVAMPEIRAEDGATVFVFTVAGLDPSSIVVEPDGGKVVVRGRAAGGANATHAFEIRATPGDETRATASYADPHLEVRVPS
jgi:HSP20 family molecular chaperone IbpA